MTVVSDDVLPVRFIPRRWNLNLGVQGVCPGSGQFVHGSESGLPQCGALAS